MRRNERRTDGINRPDGRTLCEMAAKVKLIRYRYTSISHPGAKPTSRRHLRSMTFRGGHRNKVLSLDRVRYVKQQPGNQGVELRVNDGIKCASDFSNALPGTCANVHLFRNVHHISA